MAKAVQVYSMARANHGPHKAEKYKSHSIPVKRRRKTEADLWGEGRQCFLRRSKDALGYQLSLPFTLLGSLRDSAADIKTFPVVTAGTWRDVPTSGPQNCPEPGAGAQEPVPCCCCSPAAHPWHANGSNDKRTDKLLFSCMSQ